jgi:hypothetical protein
MVDIEHTNAFQSVGMGVTEIGNPIVICLAQTREELTILNVVPEQALAGLENRAPDTIQFELFEHRVWLIGSCAHVFPDPHEVDRFRVLKAPAGLGDRAKGDHLGLPKKPGIRVFAVGVYLSRTRLSVRPQPCSTQFPCNSQ